MLRAFRILDTPPVKRNDDDADDDESRKGGGASKQRGLPRSVRFALENYEDSFVYACHRLHSRPAHPGHVLAYAGLCARLILRYRLRDDENFDDLWRGVDSVVRALFAVRRSVSAGPVIGLLVPAKGVEPDQEIVSLLAGLMSLLHWRAKGGRLEGEGAGKGHPTLSGDGLREALAAFERFADGTLPEPALPKALGPLLPGGVDELKESLADLASRPAPSDRVHWLARAMARRGSGENTFPELLKAAKKELGYPGLQIDEKRLLQAVDSRRPPMSVVPWLDTCPGCNITLSAQVRSKLAALQPAQCGNGMCRRWLLPSEAI